MGVSKSPEIYDGDMSWGNKGCKGVPPMSAFGGKADVNHQVAECPLIAISGHASMSTNVPHRDKASTG